VVGGQNWLTSPGILQSSEIYDPATGTFAAGPNLQIARWRHSATMLADGRVLVLGGLDSLGQYVGRSEIYNPVSNTFTTGAPLAVARYGHTATLLNNGRLLVVGGYTDAGPTTVAEIYDPASGQFSSAGSSSYRMRRTRYAAPYENSVLAACAAQRSRRARRACEGAARAYRGPASDRAGVRGRAPV
jgi:hypothetical protein